MKHKDNSEILNEQNTKVENSCGPRSTICNLL